VQQPLLDLLELLDDRLGLADGGVEGVEDFGRYSLLSNGRERGDVPLAVEP
jgi:hypothetical protein